MLIRSKHDGYWGDGIRLYLGGGGSSSPPPDPRLVEAQIDSMNIQGEAAQAIMRQSAAFAPIQMAQMQFGLQAAQTAFADSREDRKYMLERRGHLTGMQDSMLKDAREFNSPVRQEEMAAQAVADAETQLTGTEQASARNLTRMGVNPASGAFTENANASSLAKAGIKTASANAGRTQAREEGRALTDRAANALAGYPAMGMAATQNSAANGMAGLTVANQALAGMTGGYGAAASAAGGMGSTANSLYGTQAGMYNSAQNAAAQEQAGMWGAVGTGVGVYAAVAI